MPFQLVLNKTFAPPDHLSSTDYESTTKEQELTKQYFLPPPYRYLAQNLQYQY